MNRLLCALVNGAALCLALTAAVWLLVRIVPRRLLNAAELKRLRQRIAEDPL